MRFYTKKHVVRPITGSSKQSYREPRRGSAQYHLRKVGSDAKGGEDPSYELEEKAKEIFNVTGSITKAVFMLKDGTMLGTGDRYQPDRHGDIADVYDEIRNDDDQERPEDVDPVGAFMEDTGAMAVSSDRYIASNGYKTYEIHLSVPSEGPSQEQIETVKREIRDLKILHPERRILLTIHVAAQFKEGLASNSRLQTLNTLSERLEKYV